MKKIIGLAIAAISVWAGMMIIPAVAQMEVKFWHWPTLYDAAENLVVKNGINRDGTPNEKIYLRIGWGPCLAIYYTEWERMVGHAQVNASDRYMNLRDYAEPLLNPADDEWDADDNYNCPSPLLEVKPYWRGSRPVFYRVLDEAQNKYVKGRESPYRIAASDVLATCIRYGTADASGDLTNYWMLADDAEVYRGEIVLTAGEIAEDLVTICQEQDTDILNHRW